ncbi:response regulator transcription factor [Neptuniibacter sp. 1_MG-2023]|jgi:two-component system response regulator RegA|uniref:response regulator transcription factor n=1 Tax=Neptuniibacter sp. 1_MG-2023 TaxID=3062662 RepID=UPI0026E42ABD|nr:response regulator transcription factor [Neptuniibacter sp. 1_MG-2023]MDO6593361.1 response regulator transcription factor [Neptuniibacter sp. 1_MG-2023]
MTKRFLIVDDDPTFTRVLSRAMTRRGFDVQVARSAEDTALLIENWIPDLATVDLKMEGSSGLSIIPHLKEKNAEMRILMLTGYASIATAVEAIKLGATQYLPKPADAEQILAALDQVEADAEREVTEQPMSVNRLEWEHIQKVLNEHEGNISATARALGMHRRTLQRKLAKRPVKR